MDESSSGLSSGRSVDGRDDRKKQPKRTRTKAPKTKGGCVTCKARHVKCDETKPSCLRCLRFWGRCEGYSPPKPYFRASKTSITGTNLKPKTIQPLLPHLRRGEQAILYRTAPSGPQETHHAPVVLYKTPPSQSSFRNASEHRYFQAFRTDTVEGLPGLFTTSLWETVILQACHDEEFVRDAAVAIGALSSCGRSLIEDGSERQEAGRVMGKEEYRFALSHYGHAVAQMRKVLSAGDGRSVEKGKTDLRKALVGCLLVICFESLQGNYVQALMHAVSGNQLLQGWLSKQTYSDPRKEGLSSPRPEIIEDELILAFGRLDLQVMAYVDLRPASAHEVLMREGDETILHMPKVFKDVDEARLYWELVQRRSSHFIAMVAAKSASAGKAVPTTKIDLGLGEEAVSFHAESNISGSLPAVFREGGEGMPLEYRKYRSEIRRWFSAFTPFYASLSKFHDERSWTAASLLQIHALTSEIMLLSSLFGTESSLDEFLPEYKEVVELARQISESRYFQAQKFKFDLGIVNPLRMVGKWCRDGKTRRETIRVLRDGKVREGLYDGLIMSWVQEWVMGLEEEGLEDGKIREEMRWRVTGVRLDCLRRRAEVDAERLGRRADGTKDVRGTVITW